MNYLEPYRSLFTIVSAVIAIILFDVSAPVADLVKIIVTGVIIGAVIATFLYMRKHKPKEPSSPRVVIDGRKSEGGEYTDFEIHGKFDKIIDDQESKNIKAERFKIYDGDKDESG